MRIALLLAAGLLAIGPAQAQPPSPGSRFEITPMIGYRGGGDFEDAVTGETLDLDEGESFGLILNIEHGANTQWEFLVSHQRTELKPGPSAAASTAFDLDVTQITGGGI